MEADCASIDQDLKQLSSTGMGETKTQRNILPALALREATLKRIEIAGQESRPSKEQPGSDQPRPGDADAQDGDVAGRILKFLKQMNADDDHDALMRAAIAQHWLDEHGAPTADGHQLASGLEDMETAQNAL